MDKDVARFIQKTGLALEKLYKVLHELECDDASESLPNGELSHHIYDNEGEEELTTFEIICKFRDSRLIVRECIRLLKFQIDGED